MKIKLALSVLVAMSPSLSQASVVFSDNFDTYAPALNTAPAGWSIGPIPVGGTVDIVGVGDGYGITCSGGSAACIDLDGSTSKSGILVSPDIAMAGGVTYTATFELSGNQRVNQTDTVAVTFGTSTASFALANGTTFFPETVTFTPSTTGVYKLSFLDDSNNNYGAILDNVSVQAVPEPATYALMAVGLGLVGFASRRKAG